jgi:hypothetical protein
MIGGKITEKLLVVVAIKKIIFALGIMLFCITIPLNINAQPTQYTELLEDTILALLFPRIQESIEHHLGSPKQFFCQQIIKVKKRDPGSFYFSITVQVQTFEGAHNPPYDLVTITFNNFSGGWKETNFESRRLNPEEMIRCRNPVLQPLEYKG